MLYDKQILEKTSDKELYSIDFSYPKNDDEHLQSKLLTKKELYEYRIKHKPELKNYPELKKYRDSQCSNKQISLAEQQIMLSKFFNVNSSQNGILLFHGLGTGKTCSAVTIAETFKKQCTQYNTKILILVPGPTIKQNWQTQIVKCTGDIYNTENRDKSGQVVDFYEFYRIMSFKSFNKKVLGERIKNDDTTKRNKYQKDEHGEYIRKENYDKIENLNNTLLIVDEAHNITGNTTYDSLKKIINNSTNLKILLLTGTPMKNIATDIIDLINLLRPKDEQIKKSDIFSYDQDSDILDFASNGKENLKDAVKGYISYYRGGDPYIFALEHDIGEVSKHLKFTKIIPCKLSKFHNELYQKVKRSINAKLEQATNSVVNFCLPKLDHDKIIPVHGTQELKQIITNLKHSESSYNTTLKKFLSETTGLKDIPTTKLLAVNNNGELTGQFLHENFLYIFSTKFAQALHNINDLIINKRGVKTAFIYSNLVLFGINMFKQVLLQNGYMEFKENTQKTMEFIPDYIRCYYCGHVLKEHTDKVLPKNIPKHEYYPACFITITGDDNNSDPFNTEEEDNSKKILDSVFSDSSNSDGKYIKFVLGSRVLSEGFNLKNVGEVHILDTWFNFARMEQVIGRGIRRCSHMAVINEDNPYPKVNVYKYCVVINDKEPSSEELLYQKAERKHILIKEIEHVIKENAFDCALNYEGNKIYNANKYKKCVPITTQNYDTIQLKEGEEYCPVECDYQKCELKCADPKLKDFYNEKDDTYIVSKDKLDKSTYSNTDIDLIRYQQKIKDLFIVKYIYELDELLQEFKPEEFENFDLFYFYLALDSFIPQNENEFNNLTNILIDKYNRPGYLIYVNKFYIFQPFDMPENETMNYRTKEFLLIENNIGLYEYLNYNNMLDDINVHKESVKYDFDTYRNYYVNKKEFAYVGIIDKEPNKKKNKTDAELKDVFRLRKKITMKTDKKRESGLQSYIGSVCFNSYDMNYIKKVFQTLKLSFNPKLSRNELCTQVQEKLYELEKYSNDGFTYLIIPCNHPTIPFPLNLKDRIEFIKDRLKERIKDNLIINVESNKKDNKKFYKMILKKNDKLNDNIEFIKELGFEEKGNSYEKIID